MTIKTINENITLKFVLEHKNENLSWFYISMNDNIKWEDIK